MTIEVEYDPDDIYNVGTLLHIPSKKGKPIDVTSDFDVAALPVPPIATLISGGSTMDKAHDYSYLGTIADAEEKSYVTRSVMIPKDTDILLNKLADDNERMGYESKAHIIRHAVQMLLEYYQANGVFLDDHKGLANDILNRQHELRLDAQRAKSRAELRENLNAFDDEMSAAVAHGDFEYIARKLTIYRDMLDQCPTVAHRQLFWRSFAGSVVTRQAVAAFWQWAHEKNRMPVDMWKEEWVELSDQWSKFYFENDNGG